MCLDEQFHFVGESSPPCATNLYFKLNDPKERLQESEDGSGDSSVKAVVYLGHSSDTLSFDIQLPWNSRNFDMDANVLDLKRMESGIPE